MRILKFGGTSVGSPDSIRRVLAILRRYAESGGRFAVVVSAFSKVTDTLIELANRAGKGDEGYQGLLDGLRRRHNDTLNHLLPQENRAEAEAQVAANFEALGNILQGVYLLHEVSPRTLDFIVSFGEQTSALILAHALKQEGIPARYLDARAVVRTDTRFGSAMVDFEETNRLIREYFDGRAEVQVVTGFIGSTADGLTTTLGRGGSDYTAAIFGAALDAEAIEIWTDVDGVLTADPRRVKKAFSLASMTYREAMEMSHFGAKVIYPPTIQPALAKGIPLLIRNTFNPDFPGTFVGPRRRPHEGENRALGVDSDRAVQSVIGPDIQAPALVGGAGNAVKGISSINQISLLTLQGSGLFGVPGIAARLFGAMAQAGVNVVLITQGSSESSITFAISPTQAALAGKAAEREFQYELRSGLVEPLRIESDFAVVAIVGEGMRYMPGIAGRLFQALGKNGINVAAIAQGSSELNISVVVPADDETKALNAIHETFFLSDTHTIHLFMVGVGLIGGTLLEQIGQQAAFLRQKLGLEIRVAGLANSRKMAFSEDGLPVDAWKSILNDSGEPFAMPRFLERMTNLNLPNAIFLDNTGSGEVAGFYEQILDASISISTPNKIAASSSFLHYQRLKQTAAKRNVLWRYETNVGAGLPVINTLNDLMHSGDRILKIEGVLSGTLSYIFNNFKSGQRFSDIVRTAKKLGLTEPDPRDDLSGADVRRKLLILAREAGLPLEISDIRVEPLLPQACLAVRSVDEFFTELEKYDADFEARRAEAERTGAVLRLVARLEGTEAVIGLQRCTPDHPFYFLDGSDNMIAFTTERYHERPLVVRGPGAGAEVTAAGVFAEVIGIASALT